ncbi:MspA protein [Rhodococcus maanshanensis]|uniref:MspA protein n=1 Tax=Rhodococcus maanshanensis TaxID=183556 RepID=A0A1H7X6P7_9NOCA|nr:MspA protein [Rhodococcus maanshanensis]
MAGKDIKKNGKYAVQYQDTQIEIQNCGGYAQARSYTVVEIVGNDYSKTTLYGQPFSIG